MPVESGVTQDSERLATPAEDLFTPIFQEWTPERVKIRPWSALSILSVGLMLGCLPVAVMAHMNAGWFRLPRLRQVLNLLVGLVGVLAAVAAGVATGPFAGIHDRAHVELVVLICQPVAGYLAAVVVIFRNILCYRTFNFYERGRCRNIMGLPDVWFALPLLGLGLAQFGITYALVNYALGL